MTNSLYRSAAFLFLGCLAAGLASCSRSSGIVRLGKPVASAEQVQVAMLVDGPGSKAEKDETSAEGYRFPDDRGGKLLAELLPPSVTLPPPTDLPGLPRRSPASSALESGDVPLASQTIELPHVALTRPQRAVRPRSLSEDWPLAGYRGDPAFPQAVELAAGPRVHAPSPVIDVPVALPLLARPQPEPALQDDPTAEASVAAALATALPQRTNPAPFLRLTLPDPFEHRHEARLRLPLIESQVFIETAMRLPEK